MESRTDWLANCTGRICSRNSCTKTTPLRARGKSARNCSRLTRKRPRSSARCYRDSFGCWLYWYDMIGVAKGGAFSPLSSSLAKQAVLLPRRCYVYTRALLNPILEALKSKLAIYTHRSYVLFLFASLHPIISKRPIDPCLRDSPRYMRERILQNSPNHIVYHIVILHEHCKVNK